MFRSKRPDTSDKYNRLCGWLDLKAACPVRLRVFGPVTFRMLMRTFYYRRSTPFPVLARWGNGSRVEIDCMPQTGSVWPFFSLWQHFMVPSFISTRYPAILLSRKDNVYSNCQGQGEDVFPSPIASPYLLARFMQH